MHSKYESVVILELLLMDSFRFLARRPSRSEDSSTLMPNAMMSHPAFERPSIDASPSGAPPVPYGEIARTPVGPAIVPVDSDFADTGDEVRRVRRTRSKSECLFLAKNHTKNELPSPCQEYITQIQTIMAKNDPNRNNARVGSMSTAPSPATSRGTSPTSSSAPVRRNSVSGLPPSGDLHI
ncbi:hypothetical protein H310_02872 [Aphanomyces invadans]|uniref:Uncharacterized protein n=1 Tax=Aphanomyces invadans TaxID=157072 RepID=A0A024UKH0_9STRA|nr:hypothetical protein H310_02872 [Aphanomyces invadans]ETW06690.1 hypothetical protein H310_02872 [Aphanomyces invadans]|eukprot:XP_008864765.1 hypothetical protein H310_02872 [Aphanomyces invadans]